MGLRGKLFSLVSVLLVFLVVIAITSYFTIKSIVGNYSKIATLNYPNTSMILNLGYTLMDLSSNSLLLTTSGTTEEQDKEAIKSMQEDMERVEKIEKDYLDVPFLPGEDELYQKWRAKKEAIIPLYKKVIELYNKNHDDNSAERKEMLKLNLTDISKTSDEVDLAVKALEKFHRVSATENIAAAQSSEKFGLTLMITLSVLSLLIGSAASYLLVKNLITTFVRLSDELNKSSSSVSSASVEIASTAEQLSQATTEQASSLQETSSSITEINSMIKNNTENAKQSADVSRMSLENAERGKSVVENVIKTMDQISSSNEEIMSQIEQNNKEMENVINLINEISAKTKVINDIVFQTKLLSFNASVEAARAGEQGKGFAVVAEEVGNLATMSGTAAVEISTMLDNSVKTVQEMVSISKQKFGNLVKSGKENVERGIEVAKECGGVLNEIVNSVDQVTKMSSEIAMASNEQAQGVQEVTKAIAQLDQVTQQNNASALESSKAATMLSNQAEALDGIIKELVVVVVGTNNRNEGHAIVNAHTRKVKAEPARAVTQRPVDNDQRFDMV